MTAGWASYWRQSPLVAWLLVLPPVFGVAAIVVLRYGAYPRAFLYALPVALLVAIRGATSCGHWLARHVRDRWRQRAEASLGTALAGVMIAVSAIALPLNYRYPKQDFEGALRYVTARKEPADRVTAAGMAAGVYRAYYVAPGLDFPATPGDLGALRAPGHAVWVLYSFPRDMRLRFAELYTYIRAHGTIVATFPGTVGDGTIYVARIDQP
jgi:hypothetical protein